MKNIFRSWKTTIAGLIVGGLAIALHFGYITPDVAGQIVTVATAFGLLASKDGDKTGIAE